VRTPLLTFTIALYSYPILWRDPYKT